MASRALRAGGARRAAVAALGAALLVLALAALGAVALPAAAAEDKPVARAVLFYSPACEHCRELIREGLPPVLRRYGDRLQLLAVDASREPGTGLFRRAVSRYEVPAAERGVPALVIGDRFLAGTTDIEEQFPMLVAQHLQQGGVEWPAVPGLAQVASGGAGDTVASSPEGLLGLTERPDGILDRLARDRWGNTAALVVLAAMAAALGFVVVRLVGRRSVLTGPADEAHPGRRLATAVLIVAGLSVAGYLSYATATGSAVLCGSLGSCDVVQDSSYARLFGAVPVAYIGLAGYALIAVVFLVSVLGRGAAVRLAAPALFALTLLGTAFSLYLTVLEPFVIGATCLWCLASALIMTGLLLLSAERLGLTGRGAEQDAAGRAADDRPRAARRRSVGHAG